MNQELERVKGARKGRLPSVQTHILSAWAAAVFLFLCSLRASYILILFFKDFFLYEPFSKSSLNVLQYCFCFYGLFV